MIDTSLQRLYERLGPRYLQGFVVAHWAWVLTCGASYALVANVPYLHPNGTHTVFLVLVTEIGLSAAVLLSDGVWLRRGRPVTAWIAAGRPPERAASIWHTAARLPSELPAPSFVAGTLFSVLPITIYTWLTLDLAIGPVLFVLFGVMVGGIFLTTTSYLTLDLWLRPVLRDIAARVPNGFELEHPGASLISRLLAVQILITGVAGALVAYGLSIGDGSMNRGGLGLALTALVTFTVAAGMAMLFNRAIAEPLRELLHATRRVKEGDLFARVPVVSDDEHGALATSFNEMTAELQRSRALLVGSREEERRRLRRDLHDGLGPTLSGLAMRLEAARGLLDRDPVAADALLEQLRLDTVEAIADIRRLVRGLRPPQLDELGLVGAIEDRMTQLVPGDLHVTIDAPHDVSGLPAAVEVAAYRISDEAVTNVVRHARAATCRVRLVPEDGALLLEVADDGVGLPARVAAGVGLQSMRERAAEVGGHCTVGAGVAGGTLVSARMPLTAAARVGAPA